MSSIEFIYEARDKVSQVLEKINNSVKKTSDKIRKASRATQVSAKKMAASFKKVGDRAASLGRTISTRLTAPLSILGGMAVFQGGKFEDAMASLSAITGIAGKELGVMREEIMASGERFGIDSASFAKGMELIGSKKPELLKMPKVLKDVADSASIMAKAAGIDLPQAALNLTETMNQFNIAGKDSLSVVDKLAAGSKFGAVAIPELSQAINLAGVAAKNAKLSLNETIGAIEILGERGISGARGGTQLRNVFTIMEAALSKKVRPSVIGLEATLGKLAEANLSTAAMVKLFGRENLNAATILIQNRKAVSEMAIKVGESGVALEQARIRMATFNEQAKRLWVLIKNKLINVFLLIAPALKKGVAFIGEFVESVVLWAKANPSLAKTIVALTVALGALGPVLIAVGATISAISFALTILSSPISLIVGAIALLGTGMAIMAAKSSQAGPILKNIKGIMLDLKSVASDLASDLAGAFGTDTKGLIDEIGIAVGFVVQQVKDLTGMLSAFSKFRKFSGIGRETLKGKDIGRNHVANALVGFGTSFFVDFLKKAGDVSSRDIQQQATTSQALSASPAQQRNSLDANINISATQGTQVNSVDSKLSGLGNAGITTSGGE